jgi:type IV secretory pathway VirD2 relaxase
VVRLQQFDKLRTDEIRHHYQVATLSEEVEENTDHAVYVKERQENGNYVLEAT